MVNAGVWMCCVRTCWRADALLVNGCVACGWMLCMWMDALHVDENKCKEKEEKKTYFKLDVSVWTRWHADANWMRMAVKKKKKKRKETLTGRRSWMRIVVDANGGTHGLVVAQLMTQHV